MSEPEAAPQFVQSPPRAIRVKTSAGWADLAIQGAPGTPGLPQFDYLGAWSAASTYKKGQLIVRNGVTYMCVRNTTTQPPASWPSIASMPTPVVNGQFVKGVGNAPAWQPLTQTDLPPNLGVTGAPSAGVADLNNATASGWYQIDQDRSGGQANRPCAYGTLHVLQLSVNSIRHVAYEHGTLNVFQRQWSSGAWSVWVQTQFTPDAAWRYVGQPGQPAYQNNWREYQAGTVSYRARFRKDAAGVVHVSGLVAGGTVNSTVFNLPVGYRQSAAGILHFPAVCNATFGYIHVNYPNDGDVRANGDVNSNAWYSLEIRFFADG